MAKRARFVSAPSIEAVASVPCTPGQMQTAHMLLAVLLDYPQDSFEDALQAVEDVQDTLPEEVAADLLAFTDWAKPRSVRKVQEHYVDTFDQQRRCALYLSYYIAGDTRLRGSAILGFRDFISSLGYELDRDELDDYLPVILELSATTGDHLVWQLLASHREGIEVMRSALSRSRSPYMHLLNALARTLPDIDEETYERFQRLVSQGPPTEMVGVHLPANWSTS